MCCNKSCVRMFFKHTMLFFNQCFPWCRVIRSALSFRMCYQFKPAFIAFIQIIPERFWICSMNYHRNMKLTTLLPNCIESCVIYSYTLASIVFYRKTKILKYLQAIGAMLHIFFQLFYRFFCPAAVTNSIKIYVGKNDKASWIMFFYIFYHALQVGG